jgi:sugar phosphate isomerase/epimerase
MRDFSGSHEDLSINTGTVRKQGDLLEIIYACARHKIRAVSLRRDQVQEVGLQPAIRAVRDAGLHLSGYSRAGMFNGDATRRTEIRDDNRRAVDEAKALGSCCLLVVMGGLPQFSRPGSTPSKDMMAARAGLVEPLLELFEYAKQVEMPLAIEPLHPMYAADKSCMNTIQQALDVCDAIDPDRSGMMGVAADVYHIWWDPQVMAQIARAGKERLLAFHVSDWLVPTVDLANDRGMMGDGIIEIQKLRAAVERNGFGGYAEVEIFSQRWWAMPMGDVLRTCIQRHRTVV